MSDPAVITELVLPRFDRTWSAAAVASELVDLFLAIEGLPCKLGWVQQETERQLAPDSHSALAAAGQTIARAIDADSAFHDRQAYHSRQHTCEVMLAAAALCQLNGVRGRPAQLLLLAALIHDFEHDGQPSRNFRLERLSIERATPRLVAAGVDARTRLRLAALVLATEPRDGVRAAALAQGARATGWGPPSPTTGPAELALLDTDPALAPLALMLCEADVLPSVGLTLPYAMRLQQRLATEWGRTLGPRDKLGFIDDVLSAGVIGPFFRPNVIALRQELAGERP